MDKLTYREVEKMKDSHKSAILMGLLDFTLEIINQENADAESKISAHFMRDTILSFAHAFSVALKNELKK